MALDAASKGRLRALTFHQVLLLRRQPGPLIVYTVLPLLLMLVLQPLLGLVAASEGAPSTSGTSQAAAGMAVMFSLFTLKTVGASLLEERTWHTWDRLHSTPAAFWEILLGKAVPLFGALLVQQTVLFSFAVVVLGLYPRDAWWPLGIVIVAWSTCVLLLGTAASTLIRSPAQLSAIGDIVAMLASILGGALVPATLLPEWLRALSPLVPSYWALRSYQAALTSPNLSSLIEPLTVLGLYGAVGVGLSVVVGRRQAR
jgi:ABC-2 type transport system permease protein